MSQSSPKTQNALNAAQALAALSALPDDAALSPQQAALYLGVSVSHLERMRVEGVGPAFAKIGGAIRYKKSDLK